MPAPGADRSSFLREILVHCPRCGSAARVVCDPAADTLEWAELSWDARIWRSRRLRCPACGMEAAWPSRPGPPHLRWSDDGAEPFFGARLLLCTTSPSGDVWAYDCAHLDLLVEYARHPRGGAVRPEVAAALTLLPAAVRRDRAGLVAAIARLEALAAPG